jgi:hypothetical protein
MGTSRPMGDLHSEGGACAPRHSIQLINRPNVRLQYQQRDKATHDQL